MARIWCEWTADNLLVIPDADFDPKAHRLYDEVIAEKGKAKAKAEQAAATGGDTGGADTGDQGKRRKG